jgi:hypothetical protein
LFYPPQLKFISGRIPVDISADLLTTKILKKYQDVPCRDHKDTANTFYGHNFQFIHFSSSQSDFHHNLRPHFLHTRKAGFFLVNCFITNPRSAMPPKNCLNILFFFSTRRFGGSQAAKFAGCRLLLNPLIKLIKKKKLKKSVPC